MDSTLVRTTPRQCPSPRALDERSCPFATASGGPTAQSPTSRQHQTAGYDHREEGKVVAAFEARCGAR